MSDADFAVVRAWLEQQGFAVQGVSQSHNRISFSGTAAQAADAFGTALHNFGSEGRVHFKPVTAVILPSAIAAVTQSVTGLSSFRPHSHVIRKPPVAAAGGLRRRTLLLHHSTSAPNVLTQKKT